MTLAKRLCLGAAALLFSATALPAAADSPNPLSDGDARAYAAAFISASMKSPRSAASKARA